MRLETEHGGTLEEPSEVEIRRALEGLDGFAILGQDELTYMQTAGNARDGYVLEYQEGSTQRHYACPERLSADRVAAAFVAYARGDASWRTAFRWEPIAIQGRSGCLSLLVLPAAWAARCLG